PTPSLPMTLGKGGEGVGLMEGKRVYFEGGISPFASVAERTLVDPSTVFSVPDYLTHEQAVTIGIAGSTAWIALSWRGKIKKGETVLILGATGAVGIMAVQAAKLLGAGRVIAAGRNVGVLESLKSVGADAVVVLDGDVPAQAAKFAEASQGKLDLVIDMLWGPSASAALMAASAGARLVSLGISAAIETPFSTVIMMMPQSAILGFSMATVPFDVRKETYALLADYVRQGYLKLKTEVYPLSQFNTAWEKQQNSPHGKIIIDLKK
ncbi:MAG TPA: zinc-binding alcohol dehydrogenase family protein, partial [bacterium]|nr:zinc-binding alcohol dehydrogenase family protein [bacterium]